MPRSARNIVWLATLVLLVAAGAVAQNRGWGRRGRGRSGPIVYTEGNDAVDERLVKTAREIASHSSGTPEWTNPPAFSRDVWTFARVIRDRGDDAPYSAGNWITDFPDSDLNLSFRVQQMTSLRVDPDGRILRLTDPDLPHYPWIYTVEPGGLSLRDEEVPVLRRYLVNGGVLMADDFWGQWQWDYFAAQIRRVLPEREFKELDISHPLFHSVFDLKGPVSALQTPGLRTFEGHGENPEITWERHPSEDGGYEDCRPMHVRAIFDDRGRIMVIATFNCDNGDGWEREGENQAFFQTFSEKRAFPLGINILVYLMTH